MWEYFCGTCAVNSASKLHVEYVLQLVKARRHTFATQLLNMGCRVTSIQKLLEHSNVDTTMAYARAFDKTVMLDYFSAIDVLESQAFGAWHGMNKQEF